ncbi:Hypothetical predicted protein [Drosophila guanche]|uniref:FLYWCH-type domain-containing protein n=1 Tax=Drosophila guanche TaxID=7266 RepID=A0A3B0KSM8_DROGU|nr:Hypothetical predicted protein [Drosophila guanche]
MHRMIFYYLTLTKLEPSKLYTNPRSHLKLFLFLAVTAPRRQFKKPKDFDGSAEFKLSTRKRPKLIIDNEKYIIHRIRDGNNMMGSWRCRFHHKGCRARASTFMVGSDIKYRSSCSSHNHKNVKTKSLKLL